MSCITATTKKNYPQNKTKFLYRQKIIKKIKHDFFSGITDLTSRKEPPKAQAIGVVERQVRS